MRNDQSTPVPDQGNTRTPWNVETLGAAVEAITGSDTAAVSWADAAGSAVYRSGRTSRPPRLVVGVCVRDDETEAQIRELPGFVRLTAHEETDVDGDPVRVLRVVVDRGATA
jgi:hypothetical protein